MWYNKQNLMRLWWNLVYTSVLETDAARIGSSSLPRRTLAIFAILPNAYQVAPGMRNVV